MLFITRSEKLKPFWLSIHDENLSALDHLSNILLSSEPTLEYRDAVTRALDTPGCKVVPFFGSFLRDLRSILSGIPSIVVFPSDENHNLEVSALKYLKIGHHLRDDLNGLLCSSSPITMERTGS